MSSGDAGLRWSEGLRRERRRKGTSITRKLTMVLFLVLLVGGGKLLGRVQGVPASPSTSAGSGWSSDLEEDRHFERSLVWRMVAVLLLVAILTVARQLLS